MLSGAFSKIIRPPFDPGLSAAISWLLRDEFTTDDDAPLTTPRTCEPGPGSWNVTQTDNTLSISGGELVKASGTSVETKIVSGDIYTFADGLAIMGRRIDVSGGMFISFEDQRGGWLNGTNLRNMSVSNVLNLGQGSIAGYYIASTIRGTTRDKYLLGNTIYWVDATSNTTSYKVESSVLSGTYQARIDWWRVAYLSAPWNSDYGIVTQMLSGARSPGDTFAHEADCLVEFTVTTLPSSGQIEVRFRVQDATNYWQVTIDSSGNLDLDEVVGGVVTQRGTSAGVVASGERIVIIAFGSTIYVVETITRRINYTSATNFQAATNGELETEGTGGSVSNIISWPRNLSGAALTELQKYTS